MQELEGDNYDHGTSKVVLTEWTVSDYESGIPDQKLRSMNKLEEIEPSKYEILDL